MKAFTSIEQSKKLAEILPLVTADMDYIPIVNLDGEYSPSVNIWDNEHIIDEGWIPAWSLASLLDVLTYPHIEQNYMGQWFCRVEQQNTTYLWEGSNPVDVCFELILKLHERELL